LARRCDERSHFIASETPFYVGRAVASLASDPNVFKKTGKVFSSWELAKEYGFTDIDGSKPDWGTYLKKMYSNKKKQKRSPFMRRRFCFFIA
jgi:hypothetical protein